MCMALYIASDEPVSGPSWSDAMPAFNVQAITDVDAKVRSQFSKPHVAYRGAHTGCSCGFSYGETEPTSDTEQAEEQAGRASVGALRSFLTAQLTRVSELQLFACWEGDQGEEPVLQLTVTPSHFDDAQFSLPEKALFKVSDGAAQQADAPDEARRS